MSFSRPLEQFVYDLRHAFRVLRSGRSAVVVLIATLALGIGTNTAMFTIVNALLVRSLPVHDPGSLYGVTLGNFCSCGWVERDATMNYALWKELRGDRSVFSSVFAYAPALLDISRDGEIRLAPAAYVSSEMWDVLGVRPVAGRPILGTDEKLGSASAVAVISEQFWESEFSRDPGVIGRSITVGGRPVTIVGVAPRTFHGVYVGTGAELFLPLEASSWITAQDDPLGATNAQHWWIVAAGRLQPGLTLASARQRIAAWSPGAMRRSIPSDFPRGITDSYLRQRFELDELSTGFSYVRETFSRPLLIAEGLLGLLLLLACANIATLQLGRGLARQREFAVRLAIGASRLRLGWHVLLESLLLAAAGATLGVVVASPITRALAALYDTRFEPLRLDLAPDWHVLAFTAGLAAATALAFGLAPAVQAMRTDAQGVLKSVRGTSAVEPLGRGLLAVQVSLAVVLGSMALLFGSTLRQLTTQDVGFTSDGVVLLDLGVDRAGVDKHDRARFYRMVLDRLSALPGVASAAASYVTPLSGSTWQSNVVVTGSEGRRNAHAFFHVVTPGFFETYGTNVIAGRPLTAGDRAGAAQAVLVNQAFVRDVLNGESIAGTRIRSDLGEAFAVDAEIVGIVADAKYRSLRAAAPPTVYVSMAHDPLPPPWLAIGLRVKGEAGAVMPSLRETMKQIDPRIGYMLRSFDEQVGWSVVNERATAHISGLFGTLALVLAGVGVYGFTAYSVRQRQPEIGIRLALGATAGRVVRLLLTQVGRAVVVGALIGALFGAWSARVAAALLYGVSPASAWIYFAAIAVLLATAAVAVTGPALRAARVDPAQTLRME